MKGSQAALIVISLLTGKPLMLIHTQIKCTLCTRAYNQANRSRTEKMFIDGSKTFSHAGICYRTSSHSPAVSEEYSATQAARLLLMDDKGHFRDDDHMCFGDEVCTDNDTRGPNNFIREQNLIIGTEADEVADHVNDAGHTAKNLSNKFYDIR